MTTRWILKRLRTQGALVVLTTLAAGCGSAAGTVSASTESPTTAVAVTEPLTTEVGVTEAPAAEDAASGSGCVVSGDTIEDGLWFGYVSAASADDITFDLACWFTGDAAVAAATTDDAESPPPNDYYVRNDNDAVRAVVVGTAATVSWMSEPGDITTTESVSYADWLAGREARSFQPGVWITVTDGAVTNIEEQYVP